MIYHSLLTKQGQCETMATIEEEVETLAAEMASSSQHRRMKKRSISGSRRERLLEVAENEILIEAKKLQKASRKGKHTSSVVPSASSRSYHYGPSGKIKAKSGSIGRRRKAQACSSSCPYSGSFDLAGSSVIQIPTSQSSNEVNLARTGKSFSQGTMY